MQDFINRELETLIAQSYSTARAHHGDLGLELVAFSTHLRFIIKNHQEANPCSDAAIEFVNRLYLNDIYLTLACAQGDDRAWNRFASLYDESVRKICKCVCPSSDGAKELADSLPGQLFLHDATGRSRIASYKGISPLAAWLVIVIKHRADSERRLKSNNLESIDRIADVADRSSILRIELAIRAGRYGTLITDSLQAAVSLLSDRERIILHLRYERQLQVCEVARLFGVKSPSITKQIDRTRQKLKEKVASILATRYRLGPAVIEECMNYISENPENMALALIGAGQYLNFT